MNDRSRPSPIVPFVQGLRIPLFAAVFALVAVVVRISSAMAQDEVPPRYQELVSQAIAESSEGRWAEARALFRLAHQAYPNARSLRGIGMTSFELRDYPEVIRATRAALASEVRPLTLEQRMEAEALIHRAEPFVGQYTTAAYPEAAVFYVDGVRKELAPGRILILELGRHDVEGRWGEETARGAVVVGGGESEALDLVVRPHVEEPVAVPTVAVVPVAPDRSGRRLAGWTTFGVSLAAVVTGSVLVGIGRADAATVENVQPGTASWLSVQGEYNDARRFTGLGLGVLAVGVAGSAVGLGLALRSGGHAEGASVRAVVAPSAIRLEVSF